MPFPFVNRFYFISKHKEFSKILFYWASFGKLLENVALGVFTFNSVFLKRASGNVLGIKRTLLNNSREVLQDGYKKSHARLWLVPEGVEPWLAPEGLEQVYQRAKLACR